MSDSSAKRIFTDEQLLGIGLALATDAARGRAIRYLHEKWRIRLENFVHDEWIFDVPETLTKEDGDIIYTELMVLVR